MCCTAMHILWGRDCTISGTPFLFAPYNDASLLVSFLAGGAHVAAACAWERFIIAAAKGNFRIKSVMHGWWKTAGKIYEQRKTASGRKGLRELRTVRTSKRATEPTPRFFFAFYELHTTVNSLSAESHTVGRWLQAPIPHFYARRI
jgi:hypothetical protein